MTDPVILDRAGGVLLASAVGDALGAGYEMGSAPIPSVAGMIGGGLGDFAPGEWTDDTSMGVLVAQGLLEGGLDAIAEKFAQWVRSNPPDVGIQTRRILSGASEVTARSLTARSQRDFQSTGRGAGNGSLMRTGAVPLARLGDDAGIRDLALEVSRLTHGDPLAEEACILWSIGIDRAVREGRLDGVGEGLALLPLKSARRWEAWLQEAVDLPPETFGPLADRNNGFVVTALQAALSAIHHTPVPTSPWGAGHLHDALQRAVHVEGDTDTVAAIAGMLLGARWGSTAVPFEYKRLLHGYPGLRGRDLVGMGVRLAQPSLGASDWPLAADMTAHYRALWPADPFLAALPSDSGVLLGSAMTLARGVDVDAVVSLCRLGTSQVRERDHHEAWLVDSSDPSMNPNLEFVLRDAADAVAAFRREGKRVLLHCVAGASRTPSVAAVYLARHHGLSPQEALNEACGVLPILDLKEGLIQAIPTAVSG